MNNQTDEKSYDDFQKLAGFEESSVPVELTSVSKKIKSELVRSWPQLTMLYFLFSLIGYGITLAICSQGGVELSQMASRNSMLLMQSIPAPWCSILCGVLFSGIPFALSVALLNPFQRRFLIFKIFWLPLLFPFLGCGALLWIGHDFSQIKLSSIDLTWVLSAIMTPYAGEFVLGAFLRQKKARTESNIEKS